MKRAVLIVAICLIGSKVFSQTEESFVEEKSSGWITISFPEPPPVVRTPARRSKPAARPTTTTPAPQPAAEPKKIDAFEKTNNQVKRFKKGKSG